jgi:hypothetical protein
MPADPRPANARPPMKAWELGAVAQITLPISKMSKAAKKTYLLEKME